MLRREKKREGEDLKEVILSKGATLIVFGIHSKGPFLRKKLSKHYLRFLNYLILILAVVISLT